ncbi:unnamed protein product (macronuclear) [Paramecium tetraurelia]|uniref:RING-type domain-containing protein n=1 Tax=Paramecium tetraurelia TaxID=5888 RepID=A0DC07_PARTE|nr:uncharacterized protein GSPATT00015451001 [Paramecium tetraurelia]CAK80574.1 unnamed protein product [Paramecium tetraurelia]|eukprot:XP_001447971.1 hypothetical protein (macronuclear) [Paramecium tetraurelia strain d4-2]
MQVQNTCQICYEHAEIALLECYCKVCLKCIKHYTKIKIEEFWTSDGTHLNIDCPGGCQKTLYFDSIQQLAIQNSFIQDVHDQLFKSYCRKSIDIQQCPNNNCEFYYLKPCKAKCVDICEICQTRLENYEQISYKTLLNEITEFITTYQCPRCEVKITKNGGCSHMTCQVCKFEFCWDCKQNCKSHDWSICIYNNIFTLIIKYQLLYTLLISIGLDIYLLLIFGYVFSITYLFILNNSILLLFALMLVQLKKLNEKYEQITYHRVIVGSLTLAILIFVSYFILEQSLIDYITYIFKETLYVILIIIVTTILNQFYKQKFKFN